MKKKENVNSNYKKLQTITLKIVTKINFLDYYLSYVNKVNQAILKGANSITILFLYSSFIVFVKGK